ncbi:MAG: hypothetical protein LUF82_03770, partial [Clostridia bacterium]|nr:hypothetical protein [Clostridia bacterium]
IPSSVGYAATFPRRGKARMGLYINPSTASGPPSLTGTARIRYTLLSPHPSATPPPSPAGGRQGEVIYKLL